VKQYEPHEFAERSPPMPADQFAELKADIAENGLLYAVVIYEGRILDGRHRYRACMELGIEPRFEEFTGKREEADALERSANEHRRHLSPMARREWVRTLRDKGLSIRAVAEQVGVPKSTVADDLKEGVRFRTPEPDPEPEPCETNPTPADSSAGSSRAAVSESKPPGPPKVKGLDGKTYSASKPKAKAKPEPQAPEPEMTAGDWKEFFARMEEVQKFTASVTKRSIPKEMKSWQLVEQLEAAARRLLQAAHRLRAS
jgi:ParB family chromosome partitioning protein